jgi:hypothetical protein
MRRVVLLVLLAITVAAGRPGEVAAQDTRGDSAAVLLRSARVLEAQGKIRLARALLRYLVERYPETLAAGAARDAWRGLPEATITGLSRTGFLVWNTLYGAFLGVAVPAAFDAEPYGVGLLIGAPLGFFASRAYAGSRPLTAGQAGLIDFGSFWGTWQGFGWRAALDLGGSGECIGDICDRTSDTAPWVAAIVGGLGGLGLGVAASQGPVPAGTSSLIFNASMWGTWYGLAAGILADGSDDAKLAFTLIGGNLGLLAAIPAAKAWRPSPDRIRTISAAGLAGGFAGLGVLLIAEGESDQAVVSVVSAGVTAGLVAGTLLTRHTVYDDHQAQAGPATAVVSRSVAGWRVGLPLPTPAMVPAGDARGRRPWAPGVRVSLVDARF